MKIKLSQIRVDGGTQSRVRMCAETVSEYASKMSDGVQMPPLDVFYDGNEYWLADGFHRYSAAKSNGNRETECTIHEGSVEDAMLYSFSANGGRGLSMTPEDNQSIISRMLAHPKWKSWTDVQIAKHIHVSNSTVGRIRRKLEDAGKIEKKLEKKYINKHGQESTMKVGKIGREPTTKEFSKESEPSDDLIQELTHTISELSEENTVLKDKIAIGQWDASEIEKVDAAETIASLREQVKQLESENRSLKESRDMYMNRNAELTRTVKSLQAKLKKLEPVDV